MSLKATATEILTVLEQGRYVAQESEIDFSDHQQAAVRGTKLYRPEELALLREVDCDGNAPTIEVTDGTTQVIARQMVNEAESHRVALLNFASARNPGGGFLSGAKAQEEDLCRCSGLYACLTPCTEYYETNRRHESLLYTDYAIFSPDVPFFKTRGTGDFLPNPFLASVITTPAPNTGPFLHRQGGDEKELETTFLRRWENVLCIARDSGIRQLLLGAWGCGAFQGDPTVASQTARSAIERLGSRFSKIVFAIPGKGRQSKMNLQAFRNTFAA